MEILSSIWSSTAIAAAVVCIAGFAGFGFVAGALFACKLFGPIQTTNNGNWYLHHVKAEED